MKFFYYFVFYLHSVFVLKSRVYIFATVIAEMRAFFSEQIVIQCIFKCSNDIIYINRETASKS